MLASTCRRGIDSLLRLIEGHGDLRFQALVNTRLGYVLEANQETASAVHRFWSGHDLHDQMGQRYYAMNALAGLARIATLQGDHDTALTMSSPSGPPLSTGRWTRPSRRRARCGPAFPRLGITAIPGPKTSSRWLGISYNSAFQPSMIQITSISSGRSKTTDFSNASSM